MDKVWILMLDGSLMEFPAEHAKKVIRKNDLVRLAIFNQELLNDDRSTDVEKAFYTKRLQQIMQGIRRLNRQIPPCGVTIRLADGERD